MFDRLLRFASTSEVALHVTDRPEGAKDTAVLVE
jgi:hypothetical protein